jgi:NADPH-dependent curcumin reductase CurA
MAYHALIGATGLTAYVGIVDIGEVKEGETVVVTAAAGATGSIAVQIAKLLGARVIGIAGSDEKCAWLVDDLGIDGAINYKRDDVHARLKELCPKRIDVFFDNVGGPVLDAGLARLNMHGRVVLCGAISSYNDAHRPPGPANYLNLIQRRASMRGFLSLDHWGRFAEIAATLSGWVAEGKLTYRAHFFEGLESAPGAQRDVHRREHRQDHRAALTCCSTVPVGARHQSTAV